MKQQKALVAQAKFSRRTGTFEIGVIRKDLLKKLEQIRDYFEKLIFKICNKEPVIEVVSLSDGGYEMHLESDGRIRRIFTQGRFAAIIPGDSAAELVITNGINNFLNLYNFALVGRLLLTWFPSRPAFLEGPLSTLCDPYLNLFRGIIPPFSNIDFSPILAFVVLNVFTSSAAALPADLNYKKRLEKGCAENELK